MMMMMRRRRSQVRSIYNIEWGIPSAMTGHSLVIDDRDQRFENTPIDALVPSLPSQEIGNPQAVLETESSPVDIV